MESLYWIDGDYSFPSSQKEKAEDFWFFSSHIIPFSDWLRTETKAGTWEETGKSDETGTIQVGWWLIARVGLIVSIFSFILWKNVWFQLQATIEEWFNNLKKIPVKGWK